MNINATLFGQLITFALFVWFCMKYVWPPLINAIEERRSRIADALADSEKAQKQLMLVQAEVEEHLEKARREAQAIIDNANRHGSKIVEEARAEAVVEKKRILERAHIEIEAEHEQLRQELRQQLGELVTIGVEKVVEQTVDTAADKALIDKVVDEL